MQRYFVDKTDMTDKAVTIRGDDVKHIRRVMRMEPGDLLICSDNNGRTARCSIDSLSDEEVVATVIELVKETTEMPVKITIAQGLPKGDKLEYVVQKGTELGANRFIPFEATRSIVKWDAKKQKKKIERLAKIAKEASEQSHRSFIPEVTAVQSLDEIITVSRTYETKLIAYEEVAKAGDKKKLAEAFEQTSPGSSILIIIGPEGGLTEDEVSRLEDEGFNSCGFGPRILRTETASLYVLAAASYYYELMR
ncbi:16S rRNA (uracil(1498)-N(3))-methyltransferase [Desertibacillus haloalkaliphilus]|uniref:16S rRNA (uracil(1498)-N(3))-methyltransferase n=1 Tax=Desertibacillus haloalkaliphilus TaxID=1328930 RepID=UPI001C264CBE|nr:16S rRNA (uracil(1498)-N(3))-methyltransferase [Desertibacillus haloalkaliphilus]MBU8905635.1 16S rRNA (uracil(1498)-N(3))-methyltransferase [Desertibacillus haloalkaliphilus]